MTAEAEYATKPAHDEVPPEASTLAPIRPAVDSDGQPSSENAIIQDEPPPPDLEQLARAPSGPAYSVFNKHQKGYIVFMVALGGFFSPLSGNIYFPALNTLARDLKVSNELINLTLTSYMIFQGFAPTIFGDLGDMTGRRPAYVIGFVIYIGANIGLALQNEYAALFLLRCLQSTGSSGTVALGNGVVGDVASSGERGKYMGMCLLIEHLAEECADDLQASLNSAPWQHPPSLLSSVASSPSSLGGDGFSGF